MQREETALPVTLTPIGIVRNGIHEPRREEWQTVESEIILRGELLEAVEGLGEFSHITVLYWMHLVNPEEHLLSKVHPQGRGDLPLVGVLATRSPSRPNPIGVTTVRLLEQQGTVLRVMGLDAVDGTPVLDIKPFVRGFDLAEKAKVPQWVRKLQSRSY